MSGHRFRLVDLLQVLVAGLAVVFVGLQVHSYTTLSPIDELQHVDYLYRAPAAPAPADRVGQEAMRQQDCRGVDAPGFPPGACSPLGSFDPSVYQEKGYNTAAANTPLYYTLTRAGAEVVERVTPATDLVTAGRLTGGLWFALGLVLTYVAGRRRGVPAPQLLVVSALLVASPALVFPSATITPDASGLAAGALLLLVATWWEERPGPRRTGVLVLVAALVSFLKMTNLVAVAAIALYVLVRPVDAGRGATRIALVRARLVPAALVGGVSLAMCAAWLAYVGSRAQIPSDDLPDMMTRFRATTFPWNGVVENALVLLQPLSSPWVVVGSPTVSSFTTAVVSILLVGGTLAAAFFGGAHRAEATLALCVVAAAVVGSALLIAVGYLSSGTYFPLPARYGIALVAPMAVVTAACLRRRPGLVVVGGIAVIAVVTTAVRLSTLP